MRLQQSSARMKHSLSRRRRGALLLLVLITGTIVAVISLGALVVQRAHLDSSTMHTHAVQSRLAARSAVAQGVFQVSSNANWRNSSTPGIWNADVPLNNGHWTLQAVDTNDSTFDNNMTDPLRLHGVGSSGEAQQRTALELTPAWTLRGAFQMNLSCGGRLTFDSANVESSSWLAAGMNVVVSGSNVIRADVRSAGAIPSTGFQCRRLASTVVPPIPSWSTLNSLTGTGQSVDWSAIPTASAAQVNVVRNGDFGLGEYGWEATGNAILRAYSSGGSGDGACVQLEDRQSSSDSLVYDVTGSIRNGVPVTFAASVLPRSADATFQITLTVTTSGQTSDAAQWNSPNMKAGSSFSALQQISTILVPAWTGRLQRALLTIRTTGPNVQGRQDFRLDDVSLALSGTLPGGHLYRRLVCSATNPFGVANHAQGIYLINCAGNDVTIMDSRIHGTLVFLNAGCVIVRDSVYWDTVDPELPALLVDGDLELRTTRFGLNERELNTNMNPSGCPDLNGSTDSSLNDVYPSLIHGLIAATGDVLIDGDVHCNGTILTGQDVVIRQRLVLQRPTERLTNVTPTTHEITSFLRPQTGVIREFD